MTQPETPPTWYADTVAMPSARPALAGDLDTDVCVIGGGLTGVSAALNLAERGYKVALIEQQRIGWGASGRNGGQICTAYSSGMGKIEAALGREDAQRVWGMAEEAKRIIIERTQRHGIFCDLTWGYLYAALSRYQMDGLRAERTEWLERYGYDQPVRLLETEEIRATVASTRYLGGLLDPGAGHLQVYAYLLGLARAAEEAGATLYEGTRALSVTMGDHPSVTTETGTIRCRHLVIAANAYLGRLVPRLRPYVMPVGSFVCVTEPMDPARLEGLVKGGLAVGECNHILNYFRATSDNRLMFGGGANYSAIDPPSLRFYLRRKLVQVFPQLADIEVAQAWSGLIGITTSRIPDFGRLEGNVYYAQGFSGQGVALSGLAGRLIAEAVAGQAERLDIFGRIRHMPFPGGPLRTPALVLAMFYFRLLDMIGR
ncbi:NAD(P)/FAD-dependent oxidoreductase [Oceanibaculum sp.]|uniref:NAD(P)/FAD-dependent oxidoreductase n=1 Tax=Oceanibaculum sp. TaxID=1903597 RepID=UPI0025836BC6|nr:FAD-binding oxidoreductase [Oceanibaculum sp.]MCH2395767.1 FAD-binding oxidoreductase [Oceanibaculum sp.]